MPPILAPSFLLTADEDDFDADFDIPDGHNVIPHQSNSEPSAQRQHQQQPAADEDWDKEFESSTTKKAEPLKLQSSSRGKVTNLGSGKAVSTDTENWDDDDDLDLPPPSTKPLRLSLSPRTKAAMDAAKARSMDQVAQANTDNAEDVSTIKVSRTTLKEKLTASSNSANTSIKSSTSATFEDFEEDLVLPSDLGQLSLKALPTLTHRVSKISLDPWGDHTASSLYSDCGSSLLSQPSPSSAPSSQPETDDDDDFAGDNDMLDGLQLPESMSSQDMQRILDSKKRLSRYAGDRVKVASPAEDDFEIGLEIGDEDLSLGRLKLATRLVGKGSNRSLSAPTSITPPSATHPPAATRVPSGLRNESAPILPSETSHSSSRSAPRSPTRKPSTAFSSNPSGAKRNEAFPSLRRTTSTFSGSLRPSSSRTALSNLAPPPLSTNPSVLNAHSSSSREPPSASSNAPSTRVLSPTSTTSATSPTPRSPTLIVKPQKSFSRLHSHSNLPPPSQSNRLHRKASLSSLDVNPRTGSSHSPSPSPELTLHPNRPSLPHANTLSHATSMRDITAHSRRYDAPTTSSRIRNMLRAQEKAGSSSDREHLKGNVFDKLSTTNVATTGSRIKSRAPLSGVFPTTFTSTHEKTRDLPASPSLRSNSPISRAPPPPKRSSPSSSRIKRRTSASLSAVVEPKPLIGPPPPRVMRQPKKVREFGDGTELDAIDDLVVDRSEEAKYRVTPSGSGNIRGGTRSGTIGRSSGNPTVSNTSTSKRGTISRSGGSIPSSRRPSSSASSQGSIDPSRQAPTLRRRERLDFASAASLFTNTNTKSTAQIPQSKSNSATPPTTRLKRTPSISSAGKRKPTLIRNLGGAGSPKVVGDMKWNPQTLRWEGNDSALRDFEVSSSTRPALITHLTGSSVGGIGSPNATALANTSFSALASGARVVGDMMFDPIRMCWLSKSGEEEDPFADMEDDANDKIHGSALEDEDEDWDEEKGGTIRAVLTKSTVPLRRGSGLSSGTSSVEGSPARSTHGRSASESDTESLTGCGSIGGGRGSSLGRLLASIDEGETGQECKVQIPPALVEACRAAEDRHRIEMRGWNLATGSYSTLSRRGPPLPPPEPLAERSHLYDIRALATRKY